MEFIWEGPAGEADVLLDGRPVALISKRTLRERADVVIEGRPWQFGKDGFELTAVATDQPETGFRAHRESFWRMRMAVECPSATYEIAPAGMLSRSLLVSVNDQEIGVSEHTSLWANRPTLTIYPEIPTAEGIFLLWVCFVMRARQSSSAAQSSNF